jgi:FdhD protein
MVLKLARARIGLACSMTAPSSLGVELAERLGITLVGRLGRDRFQVFTHPQRVG